MSVFQDANGALEWAANALRGLAFVGPDPHYAVGLDACVPGLTVAVSDDAPALAGFRNAGAECVVAGAGGQGAPRRAADPESGVDVGVRGERNALAVLTDPGVRAVFERRSISRVIVFKSSFALEQAARAQGLELIAAPASVARRWENKTAFLELGARLGLDLAPAAGVDLASAEYQALAERFGRRLVIQSPHGYAGARTVLVEGPSSFEAARRTLRSPRARVAAFVDGRPMTLNACVTEHGIAVGAPFVQRTGDPAFTPFRLGSCGQLWSDPTCAGALPDSPGEGGADAAGPGSAADGGAAAWPAPGARDAMVEAARRIGAALAADGFAGIFGVDFVVPDDDGPPLVIEVNPRLVASIAAYTQLELMAGRIPLLVRHMAAFVAPDADRADLDSHLGPLCGAQIVLHNTGDRMAAIPPGLSGRWRREAGAWRRVEDERPAIRIAQADPHLAEAIVVTGAPGRLVAPGSEWARVQRGALDGFARGSDDSGSDVGPSPAADDNGLRSHAAEPIVVLAELVAGRLGQPTADPPRSDRTSR